MNDFERLSREIDAIPTPYFRMSTITARAALPNESNNHRRTAALAVILAFIVPALALAAFRYLPVRIEQGPGNTLYIYADKIQANFHATPQTLDQIARNASYPIVWPTSLPEWTALRTTLVMGSDVVIVRYRCGPKKFAQFLIVPRDALLKGNGLEKLSIGTMHADNRVYQWTTGSERVRLHTNCLTASDVAHVRTAMAAAGAARK